MNLKEEYKLALYDSSRIVADMLTSAVNDDENKFRLIYELAFEEPYPMNMRVARVCQLCCEQHFKLILPYLDELPGKLEKCKAEGVVRSFLKIYADNLSEIHFRDIDKLAEITFNYLYDVNAAIAIRIYSFDIACKLTNLEPGLRNELRELASMELHSIHAAIKSKARKVISWLRDKNMY